MAFKLELQDNVLIQRPIEAVFEYMDDIEREHEWQPWLEKWEQTPDPAQNGVGSVRRYWNHFMGRRFVNAYEITEYQHPQRVMYVSTPDAAVQASGGTLWEAVDAGSTKVIH